MSRVVVTWLRCASWKVRRMMVDGANYAHASMAPGGHPRWCHRQLGRLLPVVVHPLVEYRRHPTRAHTKCAARPTIHLSAPRRRARGLCRPPPEPSECRLEEPARKLPRHTQLGKAYGYTSMRPPSPISQAPDIIQENAKSARFYLLARDPA